MKYSREYLCHPHWFYPRSVLSMIMKNTILCTINNIFLLAFRNCINWCCWLFFTVCRKDRDTPGVCIVRGGGGGKYTSSQWSGNHCSAERWRKPSGGVVPWQSSPSWHPLLPLLPEYWIFCSVRCCVQLTQRGRQCHQHGDHGNSCSYGDTATT